MSTYEEWRQRTIADMEQIAQWCRESQTALARRIGQTIERCFDNRMKWHKARLTSESKQQCFKLEQQPQNHGNVAKTIQHK